MRKGTLHGSIATPQLLAVVADTVPSARRLLLVVIETQELTVSSCRPSMSRPEIDW